MLSHISPEPAPPRRAIVLGARGFLGRALLDSLTAQGWVCRGVPREEVDLSGPGAAHQLRAILDPHDAIVVLAALTPDRGRDVPTLMVNLRMAEAITEALAEARCAHLVYVSSDAVYDGSQSPISESVPPNPTDLYALMHLCRERMLAHASRGAGFPFCVLRPCAIFGAGDTHGSYGPNRFIRSALTDRRIRLFGAGEEKRDHVYIGDVVAAIGMTLRRRSSGTLNLASGRSISFRDLAELIREIAGPHVSIDCEPRVAKGITHRHFDTTALMRSFPELRPTRLEEGLRRTIRALGEP